MQLNTGNLSTAYSWHTSYQSFKSIFDSFCRCIEVNSLGTQLQPLAGARSGSDDSIDVSFAGVKLRFTMLHVRNNAGNLSAEILVTRESHNFTDKVVVIGKFELKPSGYTDLLLSQNLNDFAKLDRDAGAIISEYVDIALKTPIATP